MSNIKDYGPEANLKCRNTEEYKNGLNNWIYCPNSLHQPKDFKYTCPPFVHQFYEVGNSCPEGFVIMHNFIGVDGDPFVQCGGVIKDAIAIGE